MTTSSATVGDSEADAGDESGPASIVTVIQARPGWIAINWAELAQSHELFHTLVSRDLMVRYKQTVLGVAWAVVQPVLTTIVFTIIFGMIVKVQTPGNTPYALFAYAGLVPWTFFLNSVNASSLSLLNNQNLLTKIYFPRLYVPAAPIGGFLVDMAIAFSLLAIMMPYYHVWPTWNLLALPILVFLTFAATLGVGLALSALTLLYRDLRFVIPFALQLMSFASGVQVPLDRLPRLYQLLGAINPMFGLITGFRSAILGVAWDFPALVISSLSSAAILAFGLFFFRRTERLIADIA